MILQNPMQVGTSTIQNTYGAILSTANRRPTPHQRMRLANMLCNQLLVVLFYLLFSRL